MTLTYDPEVPLYFHHTGARFRLDQSTELLALAYAQNKPVLIYLHGRAKDIGEPQKSIEKKIYAALHHYELTVIGFTWDADDGGYDESRAISSVPDLQIFLEALKEYLLRPANAELAKPSIIAHSMGNLLLAELAKDGLLANNQLGQVFNNVVLNAAAVKSKRHHLWLGRIAPAGKVYVMINPHDTVLMFAGLLFKPDMLGKELRAPGAASAHISYLDLSALDVNHRYFIPAAQNGEPHLRTFFAAALTGKAPDLSTYTQPEKIADVAVHRFKSKAAATNEVLGDES
jgi:esterase/lipase superfamily enzyme